MGPTSQKLSGPREGRRGEVSQRESGVYGAVPADAVTASGSGLDPQISPAFAELQAARVAEASADQDAASGAGTGGQNTQPRTLGFLGEPRVNVLELNLALDHR